MEDKGTQTEREGRLLTGFGGPCPTAVSGPAAHPRISLRRGLLCGSGPADLLERLTDNGPGGGGGAGAGLVEVGGGCPGNIRLHQTQQRRRIVLFQSEHFF